jgi:hypothetical protein
MAPPAVVKIGGVIPYRKKKPRQSGASGLLRGPTIWGGARVHAQSSRISRSGKSILPLRRKREKAPGESHHPRSFLLRVTGTSTILTAIGEQRVIAIWPARVSAAPLPVLDRPTGAATARAARLTESRCMCVMAPSSLGQANRVSSVVDRGGIRADHESPPDQALGAAGRRFHGSTAPFTPIAEGRGAAIIPP